MNKITILTGLFQKENLFQVRALCHTYSRPTDYRYNIDEITVNLQMHLKHCLDIDS